MKNLGLKIPVDKIGEVLKRDQMKKILGGYGGSCDHWSTRPEVCYNCCITLRDLAYCADMCM